MRICISCFESRTEETLPPLEVASIFTTMAITRYEKAVVRLGFAIASSRG